MAVLNSTHPQRQNQASSPRDKAMRRILQSYRRKVLRIYPGASFDDAYMLGCSAEDWAKRIEKEFNPSMTWENYGDAWIVVNMKKQKDVNMRDPVSFYAYFKADQFVPTPNDQWPKWLQNMKGVKGPKPEGFKAPGFPNQRPDTKEIEADLQVEGGNAPDTNFGQEFEE